MALYLFTDMTFINRYYLPITILSIPLIALFMEEVGFDVLFIKKGAIYLLFILVVFGSGYGALYANEDYDCTSELKKIIDVLEENEYLNGYGTFWNGNVLTELSNGEIEVYTWNVSSTLSSQDGIDDLYSWLQVTSHDYIKPSGKVFMLLEESEKDLVPWANGLSKASTIYQSDKYTIYGFDSYDDMKMLLS